MILSVRQLHHHIHGGLQLVLTVGEVDDKEEKKDKSKGGSDADLGVFRPEPEGPLGRRLSRRVLGVLQQQRGDVLELRAQVWGGVGYNNCVYSYKFEGGKSTEQSLGRSGI